MDPDEELRLVTEAKAGNDSAYERLLEWLVEPAHKLACGLLHDSSLADDAVQEAAVKAWRKLRNLRLGAPMRPWFLGIVANQCRESRRGHWSRLIVKPFVDTKIGSPESEAIERLHVEQLLSGLTRDERTIVILRTYVDLPWPEIAAVARVSEVAARARFYRAIAKLRPVAGESVLA
jgi:RNA polymerase sigma-70 factor (ECF subfamily)